MEQISLFDDEFILLNSATTAIKALQPDDALEALKSYNDITPKRKTFFSKTFPYSLCTPWTWGLVRVKNFILVV